MDALQRAVVSLQIHGDELNPSTVTALLGIEPSEAWAKGETVLVSTGKSILAKTGRWSLRGDWDWSPRLDRQIDDFLSRLTDDMKIWEFLSAQFYCGICVGGHLNGWAGGATLHSATLKSLAERNLYIDFDLYASDDES